MDKRVEVEEMKKTQVPAGKWRQVSPANLIKKDTNASANGAESSSTPPAPAPAYAAPNPRTEEQYAEIQRQRAAIKQKDTTIEQLQNEVKKLKDGSQTKSREQLLTPEDLLSNQTKLPEQNMDLTARNALRKDYQSQLKEIKKRIVATEVEELLESDPDSRQILQEHLSLLQKQRDDIIEILWSERRGAGQAHQQSAQAKRDKVQDQIANLVLEKGRLTTKPSRRSEIDKELKRLREQASKL